MFVQHFLNKYCMMNTSRTNSLVFRTNQYPQNGAPWTNKLFTRHSSLYHLLHPSTPTYQTSYYNKMHDSLEVWIHNSYFYTRNILHQMRLTIGQISSKISLTYVWLIAEQGFWLLEVLFSSNFLHFKLDNYTNESHVFGNQETEEKRETRRKANADSVKQTNFFLLQILLFDVSFSSRRREWKSSIIS